MKKIVLIFLGMFLIMLSLMIYTHEISHQQIYKYYGIESEIGLGFLNNVSSAFAYTNVTDEGREVYYNLDETDKNFLRGLQSINEAIGYQIIMAIVVIFILNLGMMLWIKE